MKKNPEYDSLLPPLTMNRRGFLTTSLASGFTLAAGPVMASTVITTDATGLTAGEVKIPVADGTIPAYRAVPAGATNAPTILVVQEIFGVHEHIKDVEGEYKTARFALEHLKVRLISAPDLFAKNHEARSNLRNTDQNLEGTYLVRIFAAFEAALRSFDQAKNNDPTRREDSCGGSAPTPRW